MNLFIPKDTLDLLSYRSTLGQSLKQISLSSTPIDRILDDMKEFIDKVAQMNRVA